MHKTDAGEKRKVIKADAQELEKEVKMLEKVKLMRPATKIRQEEADRLKAKAQALKPLARLEDLQVWEMEKTKETKTGAKTYTYWMASWREGKRVKNVYLGSSHKLSRDQAQKKARTLKREALGLSS